ncbi:GNAT family N-acetyltransferase [Pseudoduganella violaceinigra]|uniref:GNAT family N-acetyltransferase n=1 Tax=Pseudoduganella violaceinigra TaxID=246602 RepID=UPI000407D81F|nr:GNAT family N-acetyltransferase [Pseudoduganella violaceinigra]
MTDQSLPVAAWLKARSIARGLPLPVADHGGLRVDTFAAGEVQRWVYPAVTADLAELARGIDLPGYLVKACAAPEQLRVALPAGWQIHAPGYFMAGPDALFAVPLCPPAYLVEVAQAGWVTHVRVTSESGELAAGGYAAETDDAFIYDRIATAPAHRRRGLARLVMATLRQAKVGVAKPELLVATDQGRALYESLGWRTLSAYSTGSLPGA